MGRGEVLVAVVRNRIDWAIACEQQWYRVPMTQVAKLEKRKQWPPPRWLAFYHPKKFGSPLGCRVTFFAEITGWTVVPRSQLLPTDSDPTKQDQLYCKLEWSDLQALSQPIPSYRFRRLVYIPTTWEKFMTATEINDLWDDSPLEDRMWAALKRQNIPAERQEDVKPNGHRYKLDFAIYCQNGKIDVETDGDTYHTTRRQVTQDNIRENALKTDGWCTLRFNTHQVEEELATYCLPTIEANIQRLGGVDADPLPPMPTPPRSVIPNGRALFEQLCLFPDLPSTDSRRSRSHGKGRSRTPRSAPGQLSLF